MLALLAIAVPAFAQGGVNGKVTDSTGEPLVGVNVLVKGTKTGTMTNLDGDYSLSAKSGSVLVFSCIGFATEEITVGSVPAKLNVTLEAENNYLDDVVVVAYGTQKRKDLTGSMTEVKSEIVAIQNTTTVSRALEGTAPGL